MVFLKAQLSGRMDDPEYLIKCLIEKLENDISKAESHLSDKKPRQSKGKSLAPLGERRLMLENIVGANLTVKKQMNLIGVKKYPKKIKKGLKTKTKNKINY